MQDIVDDWAIFTTDEEKMRDLQMIFSEIRADHTTNGLSIEFEAKPIWEPEVEALLARQQQVVNEPPTVSVRSGRRGSSTRKW